MPAIKRFRNRSRLCTRPSWRTRRKSFPSSRRPPGISRLSAVTRVGQWRSAPDPAWFHQMCGTSISAAATAKPAGLCKLGIYSIIYVMRIESISYHCNVQRVNLASPALPPMLSISGSGGRRSWAKVVAVLRMAQPCAYRKSSPSILVMQSTQDRTAQNASGCLDGT
jgi:hypothetical protein